MGKINNTSTFPVVAPDDLDLLIGTDVSDVTNDISGETKNFRISAILAVQHDHTLSDITDAGTAAAQDVGTGAGDIPQLNGSAQLPAIDGSLLTGRAPTITVYNTAATSFGHTLQTNTKRFMIRMCGGGGGAGGANSSGINQVGTGAGGGSGAWAEFVVDNTVVLASSLTLSVGSGGAGGAGISSGSAGVATTYSDGTNSISCGGGGGGLSDGNDTSHSSADGGLGGTYSPTVSSGLTVLIGTDGQGGGQGIGTPYEEFSTGGVGGGCPFGGGGRASAVNVAGVSQAGRDASGNGAGGGGAATLGSVTQVSGGDGSDGIIIIYEWPF